MAPEFRILPDDTISIGIAISYLTGPYGVYKSEARLSSKTEPRSIHSWPSDMTRRAPVRNRVT